MLTLSPNTLKLFPANSDRTKLWVRRDCFERRQRLLSQLRSKGRLALAGKAQLAVRKDLYFSEFVPSVVQFAVERHGIPKFGAQPIDAQITHVNSPRREPLGYGGRVVARSESRTRQ